MKSIKALCEVEQILLRFNNGEITPGTAVRLIWNKLKNLRLIDL